MSDPFESAEQTLPARLISGISKISTALKSQAWHEAGGQGLTPTQGQILALLRARDGMRLSEVAQGLGVSMPTASDAVSSLVQKGLAQKNRSPGDARALQVALTPAGQKEAEQVAGWPHFLLEGIAELEAPEQEVFLRGLIKILHSLQQRAFIPTQRMCVTCRHFRPYVYDDSQRPHHCAFVDAPFGGRQLRLDCPDQQLAAPAEQDEAWRAFVAGKRLPSSA